MKPVTGNFTGYRLIGNRFTTLVKSSHNASRSPSSLPSFLSSSRRSLSSLLSSLSFLSSFVAVFVVVGVFAVRPSSLLKSVKRKTQRVRILVVRNLPTGPQLRSASFQSANYMYAGPQIRRSAFYPCPIFTVSSVLGQRLKLWSLAVSYSNLTQVLALMILG